MRIAYDSFSSPIGNIYAVVDEKGVRSIFLKEEHWREYVDKQGVIDRDKQLCSSVIMQLEDYFKGKRKVFELPLSVEGTDFCKSVWKALQAVPYGETRSYGDIAKIIGKPKACRAIGQANKRNPLPIIIPCHRVNGATGELTGYMGKFTDIKKYLIEMEKENV